MMDKYNSRKERRVKSKIMNAFVNVFGYLLLFAVSILLLSLLILAIVAVWHLILNF